MTAFPANKVRCDWWRPIAVAASRGCRGGRDGWMATEAIVCIGGGGGALGRRESGGREERKGERGEFEGPEGADASSAQRECPPARPSTRGGISAAPRTDLHKDGPSYGLVACVHVAVRAARTASLGLSRLHLRAGVAAASPEAASPRRPRPAPPEAQLCNLEFPSYREGLPARCRRRGRGRRAYIYLGRGSFSWVSVLPPSFVLRDVGRSCELWDGTASASVSVELIFSIFGSDRRTLESSRPPH